MDGMGGWILQNWFSIFSAAGIIASLLFTAVSLRSEEKTRRIANLLTLTQSHRELWSQLFKDPNLDRVLDASADLARTPLKNEESLYVNLVIQHVASAYQAVKSGLIIKPEGLKQDVGWFFSLPIPLKIWEKLKPLQNEDFVEFVDRCLRECLVVGPAGGE
jgi:hypothetical protein